MMTFIEFMLIIFYVCNVHCRPTHILIQNIGFMVVLVFSNADESEILKLVFAVTLDSC